MNGESQSELRAYCVDVARRAAAAAEVLALLDSPLKNRWLLASAGAVRGNVPAILEANGRDLAAAKDGGLSAAHVDRLRLTAARIDDIARAIEEVAALPDPIGETIERVRRPNGLEIAKVRVPLGVVLFIYESRPNVTADAAALCLKSGNAVILRGGKEARHSSQAIVDVLRATAAEQGLPEDGIQLVSPADRAAISRFLELDEYIDVAIPRGGEALIRLVADEARMPVMKHFRGNCHVYVDAWADLRMARDITVNSKCQRMGVCNACESLLVHAEIAEQFLPEMAGLLNQHGVEVRGDERVCRLVPSATAAAEEDYYAEFLGPIISVKIVECLDDAIRHINHYGSHHTDAIVTEHLSAARRFAAEVDSSAVMINASTRLNDGGQFGLGAEIGISTDKFHARGPCGVRELTSYKYVVSGNGHLRL
ncbi:MAG: glutamate-5-semialdehyde dehydrogenase [Planctomycetes bacterium]|nr:glutamate-5-semialdehyde dehydrogenase [Planctomycetota bacterium]